MDYHTYYFKRTQAKQNLKQALVSLDRLGNVALRLGVVTVFLCNWLTITQLLVLFHHLVGEKVIPDFFLDEGETYLTSETTSNVDSDRVPDSNTPAGIFNKIKPLLNETVVQQVGATYLFVISGENGGSWLLDLKNSSGSVSEATEDTPTDVTMKMEANNMVDMFQGKLKSTTAFMTGKLSVSGNMGLALKLDKLLSQVRSKL